MEERAHKATSPPRNSEYRSPNKTPIASPQPLPNPILEGLREIFSQNSVPDSEPARNEASANEELDYESEDDLDNDLTDRDAHGSLAADGSLVSDNQRVVPSDLFEKRPAHEAPVFSQPYLPAQFSPPHQASPSRTSHLPRQEPRFSRSPSIPYSEMRDSVIVSIANELKRLSQSNEYLTNLVRELTTKLDNVNSNVMGGGEVTIDTIGKVSQLLTSQNGPIHAAVSTIRMDGEIQSDEIKDQFNRIEKALNSLVDRIDTQSPTKSVESKLDALFSKIENLETTVSKLSTDTLNTNPPATSQRTPPSQPKRKVPPVEALTLVQIERELNNGAMGKKRATKLKSQKSTLSSSKPEDLLVKIQSQAAAVDKARKDPTVFPPDEWFSEDDWKITDQIDLNTYSPSQNSSTDPQKATITTPNSSSSPPPPPVNNATKPSATKPISSHNPFPLKSQRTPTQAWQLYLGGVPVVDPTQRLSPQAIWQRVNSLDKSKYPFTLIHAHWALSGHIIFLHFDSEDLTENILNHADEIKENLSHGKANIHQFQFGFAYKQSKIHIRNVPCREAKNSDVLISEERLRAEIAKNPLFNRLTFRTKPEWLNKHLDDMESSHLTNSSVICSFEDQDGSYLKDILNRELFLFGERVFVSVAPEKIYLPQCTRCWKIERPHTNCDSKCLFCSSTAHPSEAHVLHCEKCVLSGQTSNEDCTHLRCTNCGGEHIASIETCPSKEEATKVERKRRVEVLQQQRGSGSSRGRRGRPPTRY